MTVIHIAPQVPLPDRLYQGRVQLVEVKRISSLKIYIDINRIIHQQSPYYLYYNICFYV